MGRSGVDYDFIMAYKKVSWAVLIGIIICMAFDFLEKFIGQAAWFLASAVTVFLLLYIFYVAWRVRHTRHNEGDDR